MSTFMSDLFWSQLTSLSLKGHDAGLRTVMNTEQGPVMCYTLLTGGANLQDSVYQVPVIGTKPNLQVVLHL